jgi:hypothetical protein
MMKRQSKKAENRLTQFIATTVVNKIDQIKVKSIS